MGCAGGKNRVNVEIIYRSKGLPMPEAMEYECVFEKEAFMAINLIRVDPKLFIPQIKEVRSNFHLVFYKLYNIFIII